MAFYTLFERKLISLVQYRVGPDKISMVGLLQPVADGLKLFIKNVLLNNKINVLYFVPPILSFIFSFSF